MMKKIATLLIKIFIILIFVQMINVPVAKAELTQIKKDLTMFSPNKVIWDIEDLSKQPPWGNNIGNEISSLGNYFITCDGRDFIEVFNMALDTAIEIKKDVIIE